MRHRPEQGEIVWARYSLSSGSRNNCLTLRIRPDAGSRQVRLYQYWPSGHAVEERIARALGLPGLGSAEEIGARLPSLVGRKVSFIRRARPDLRHEGRLLLPR